MRETLVIAKRELLERVRSKWFVVMTVIGPLLMVGLIVIPALLATTGLSGAKVAIVDHTAQKLGPELAAALHQAADWEVTVVPADTPEPELLAKIRGKQLNGYLDLPGDVLATGAVVYHGDNATNQVVDVTLQQVVSHVVHLARGRAAGLAPAQLEDVLRPVAVVPLHTTGQAEAASGMGTFFLGYIVALILYMVITIYGVNVMRSVVTEKASRVIELMVAAVKPRALMAGKILGVGGAGLLQISVWLAVGGVALAYHEAILGALGAKAAAQALPSLSVAQLGVIALFFMLGYLFYATLYAAVGATVSSEQESQQAQLPVTMFLVIGMVSMTAITGNPRGTAAAVMTQVPFWSPMLMPLRYLLGGATVGEVALSLGILVTSSYLVARAAARIYRVGILMYGKRPGLAEILRWLRY